MYLTIEIVYLRENWHRQWRDPLAASFQKFSSGHSFSFLLQAMDQTVYDGTMTWKISDFAKKRQDAISGQMTSIYSSPFFTSRTGYKMCARLYLNGDGMGKGTHVSLFFVVMKGTYDALLKWPFRQRASIH